MSRGFWDTIQKPIFALAPMANVTDAAFRRIIAKYGKPDVFWTEFVSCDGLCSSGREKLLVDLWFSEIERPIVAQFFGARPEHFYECANLAAALGFDGIDINMGCPDKNVEKQGGGAALIKNPKQAQKIILETKRGAGKLPVSVKTRIGYNSIALETWIQYLLEVEPSVITIHGRTRKEMSKVPNHWDVIADAVRLRDTHSSKEKILILGNGDVQNLQDADQKIKEVGVDGVMIGRGIFGNPWFFNRGVEVKNLEIEKRLSIMLEHTFLFKELFGEHKNFDIMKKHYKAYVHGFPSSKELRTLLMNTKTPEEVLAIVQEKYPHNKDISVFA